MGILQRIFGRERRNVETVEVDDALRRALAGATDHEAALNIPAVSACVDFISGKVAELPVKLFRDNNGRAEEITSDDRLRLLNDNTGDLLDCFQMKQALVRDYLVHGAGYLYPEMWRNYVLSLRYIEHRSVAVSKGADPIFKTAFYTIGDKMFMEDELVRLLRNSADGVTGKSILDEHRELLSAAYKEIVYERYLVETGGNKKGFLQTDQKVDKEVLEEIRQRWKELYSNNESNMMVLNSGLKFTESSNTSVEMQLNENKVRNNELICQMFGLSPAVISGKATPDEFISAIKTAVIPVVTAFETALNKGLLLPSEREELYFRMDVSELLKGDILKRYQAYQVGLQAGFLQYDEVRYKEDLEPYGWNWMKLGLQDVLFDVRTQTVYTPNTNQQVRLDAKKLIDNGSDDGILEERNDGSHYTKDEHGRFTGSTGSGGSGGSGGGVSESGISGKHENANGQNSVDLKYLKSEEYKNKFKGITGNTKVDEQLYQQSKAILTHRNGTDKEDMCLIDSRTGKIVGHQSNSKVDFSVEYNSSIENAIKNNPRDTLISIHNHSTNNPPTGSDIVSNGSNGYKLGVVATHNGKVFTYKAGNKPFTATGFGKQVDKYRGLGYTEYDAIINVLTDFSVQYGVEWSER